MTEDEPSLSDIEHCRDAAKEAVHMLEENAKGFPAHYLSHSTYQDIVTYAKRKVAAYENWIERYK